MCLSIYNRYLTKKLAKLEKKLADKKEENKALTELKDEGFKMSNLAKIINDNDITIGD